MNHLWILWYFNVIYNVSSRSSIGTIVKKMARQSNIAKYYFKNKTGPVYFLLIYCKYFKGYVLNFKHNMTVYSHRATVNVQFRPETNSLAFSLILTNVTYSISIMLSSARHARTIYRSERNSLGEYPATVYEDLTTVHNVPTPTGVS